MYTNLLLITILFNTFFEMFIILALIVLFVFKEHFHGCGSSTKLS